MLSMQEVPGQLEQQLQNRLVYVILLLNGFVGPYESSLVSASQRAEASSPQNPLRCKEALARVPLKNLSRKRKKREGVVWVCKTQSWLIRIQLVVVVQQPDSCGKI